MVEDGVCQYGMKETPDWSGVDRFCGREAGLLRFERLGNECGGALGREEKLYIANDSSCHREGHASSPNPTSSNANKVPFGHSVFVNRP